MADPTVVAADMVVRALADLGDKLETTNIDNGLRLDLQDGASGKGAALVAHPNDDGTTLADAPAYKRTAAEISAGVTPVDYRYSPYTGLRYESLSDWTSLEVNFYVSTTGDNDNDGLTSGAPFLTVQKAVNEVARWASVFPGANYVINLAAGTYTEGAGFPTGTRTRNWITIKGPDVGGHPNVPTAIIDGTSATASSGISGSGFMKVKLKDIKVQDFDGTSEAGVRFQEHCTVYLDNVHIDNCYNGWYFLDFTFYTAEGGLIAGCEHGVQELFHVVRNFATVSALTDGTQISGCTYGLFAKEHCTGHLDWTTLDNNTYGVFFSRSCTANASDGQITNNDYGVVLRHGSFLVQLRIDWGIGTADANTVNWLVDHSSGFTVNEGTVEDQFTAQGERQIGYYAPSSALSHTGTTAETRLFDFGKLKGGAFTNAGTYIRAVILGAKTGTAGTAAIHLDIAGGNQASVTLGASTSGFRIDMMLASLGPSSQVYNVVSVSAAGTVMGRGTRTAALEGVLDKTVGIDCVLADAADTITIDAAWLYSTDALLNDGA